MSAEVRIIGPNGEPSGEPEVNKLLTDAIHQSGDRTLLGDWIAMEYPNKSTPVGESSSPKVFLDLREYLDALDAKQLNKSISDFKRNIVFAKTSEEMHNLINSVVFPPTSRSAMFPFWTVELPAGTRPMYRVRAHIDDPSVIRTVGDVWARPDGGTPGRMNRKGQRMLYLALATAHLAMVEAKPKDGDYVAVSQFIATEPLTLINIQDKGANASLTVRQERKMSALRNFYTWLFNYSGHDPKNPQYEAAQVFGLDMHLLTPPAIGWSYQSTLIDSPWASNIAIDADRARKVLRLVNTQIFHYKGGSSHRLDLHSSWIPAAKNVEPNTPLIASRPAKFFWDRPPQ